MTVRPIKFVASLFRDPIYRGQQTERLSQIIVWSNLAKVGRSRIMRGTILVPLIGVFIIFNEGLLNIFRLDSFFIEHIGEVRSDSIDRFTISNLYFMYFGLSFLGVGSFLFSLFCPEEISIENNIMSYVYSTDLERNQVVAKSHLQDVLNAYFSNDRDVDRDFLPPNPEYPNFIEEHFYNLINEMFNYTEAEDRNSDTSSENDTHSDGAEPEEDGQADLWSSFYFASGYPNIHEIARAVWSSPKAIWAFTLPFTALSTKFAKDIAYVRYQCLNYTKFSARKWIALLYTFGFILVLVPTIKTFARLAWNLIV